MERLSAPAILTDTIAPGYYYVTGATGTPTGASSNGYLRVFGRKSDLSVLTVMEYRPYNSTNTYVNMKKGVETWSGWELQPTRSEVDTLNNSLTYKTGDTVNVHAPFIGKATVALDGYFGSIYLPRPVSSSSLTATLSSLSQYGEYYSDGASHSIDLTAIDRIELIRNVMWFRIPATNITNANSFAWIRLAMTVTFS